MSSAVTPSRIAFGVYEVDLQTGELWRAGHRVKLQSQPFKLLTILLERPGELVSREELQRRIWGADTAGDFEHALATAIKKIREALRDSADNPRFVETLARRGYRFIAPVSLPTPPAAELPSTLSPPELADLSTSSPTDSHLLVPSAHVDRTLEAPQTAAPLENFLAPAPAAVVANRRPALPWIMATAISLAAVAFAAWFALRTPAPVLFRMDQLTHSGHFAVALDITERVTSGVTDGYRLYLPVVDRGRSSLAIVSTTGGPITNLNIPNEVAAPTLGDISPDGRRLLMRDHLSPESEQPLWVVPAIGGSAFRVGDVLAHDATFMRDGNGILYATGNELLLTRAEGGAPQPYASLPGRAFWLRWNPSGTLLRFTVIDPLSHSESLWQLNASDRKPKRILTDFSDPPSECCGVWTSDGTNFIFQSQKGGNWDLWSLAGNRVTGANRITNGPMQFLAPIASPDDPKSIYFLGVDTGTELQLLTPEGKLEAQKNFLENAARLDYSRDKQWVAWTDREGRLWRAQADGREQLQLTPNSLNVFMARWSPDGQRIAFMARQPGKAWNVYLIHSKGGTPQPLLGDDHNAADPSWSPDSNSIVFGRTNDIFGTESAVRALTILNLKTGETKVLPGSEGLFSPRWSPDGRYIMALTLDQAEERLYTVATGTWSTLSKRSGADPVWSSDSHYIYFHELLDPSHAIDRVAVPTGVVQQMIRLSDASSDDPVDYTFSGLNASDQPVIVTRTTAANVYSMRLP